jgi:predicted amidohydrolase
MNRSMTTLIRHGRIIDPANGRDEIADLLIIDGRIADPAIVLAPESPIDEIDAKGLVVAPWSDRSPRASARAGTVGKRDDRQRHPRGLRREGYERRLHAEHRAAGG